MNDNNHHYLDDRRKSIQDLYQAFGILEKDGWLKEEIILSQGTYKGALISYLILSFKTAQKGPAIWVLSGIHGEEPAGPNAIAEGIAYLQGLLNRYDGFYPLAIAAYNAGPGNVSKWIREFGDPRDPKADIIDWIEKIPIYETRNYVQRVMESYYMYRLRLSAEPVTVLGPKN